MDRGRMIDHIQNVNAMNIDSFRKTGKTSTRVIHPPGGEDHWNLAWGFEEPEPQKPKIQNKRNDQFKTSYELQQEQNYNNQMKNRNVVESNEFKEAMYNQPDERFLPNKIKRNNRNTNESPEFRHAMYNQNDNRNLNQNQQFNQNNSQFNQNNNRHFNQNNNQFKPVEANQNENKKIITKKVFSSIQVLNNDDDNNKGNDKEEEGKKRKGFVATFNMC